MPESENVIAADNRFFAALLAADEGELDAVLVDDFILVDVLSGGQVLKLELVPLVVSGKLVFENVGLDRADQLVRLYGSAAVVTGSTDMSGRYEDQPWSARSRYTHVFVQRDGAWRLASAQGTPIVEPASA